MHLALLLNARIMQMRKPLFFSLLAVLVAGPFWTLKTVWVMRSKKVQGKFEFIGNGSAGDQVRLDYSIISFYAGGKQIWFNGLGNLSVKSGTVVPIRYQPDDPYDARVDIFAGIWGDTLVYSGIPLLMLLVLFLHRQVVPWGSAVRLTFKKPFLQIISPSKISANG